MKKVSIETVSTVMSGHVFRGKAASEESTELTRVVQIPDIRGYSICNTAELARANLQGKPAKITLNEGDILFTLKGARLHAAAFAPEAKPLQVTTMNYIAIVRPKVGLIDPGYLLWYLNSPLAKDDLEQMQAGSTIPNISLKNFKKLQVAIPSQRKQAVIAQAYKNWCKQEVLLSNLLINGKDYMAALCLKTLEGDDDE